MSGFRSEGICLALTVATLLRCHVALADDQRRFNRDIRPILSENCFYCHGQDSMKRQAGLRLDVRDIAIETGAIAPHDVASSSLLDRINSRDPDRMMPPPHSNRRLSPTQKKQLALWIEDGAVYGTHWAFVAPDRPAEPEVSQPGWVRNPIDRFVLAKLDDVGLSVSPEADRVNLIKRLAADLRGLPPTPDEVDAFVADADPQAYEKLVDRFLESPNYGERLALPWLDAARYADSNGFQQDGDTWQWIWRDWVVRALNDDLPFDQFTIWQLAGDLLPNATVDQKIASGFNRNHLLNGEGGAIPEEQRFVNLFDRIDTTATTWLGLTMACAQCHDHKYDPITQRDYYSMLDAFNRVPERGTPQRFSTRIRVAAPFVELPTEENKKRVAELKASVEVAELEANTVTDAIFEAWRLGLSKEAIGQIQGSDQDVTSEKKDGKAKLREHFDKHVRARLTTKPAVYDEVQKRKKQLANYQGDQIPRVMIMSDDKPRETSILARGEYLKPTEIVTFATPAFLPPLSEGLPANRLGLARWLVSPEHPLTARVQVNRMWQYFFGTGIVKTSEDFGVQSEYPIHKALLDWLAVEFRESGWSMKSMHRLIVTSATYRQSSRMTATHRERDIENRLYARASRFRMPSMILRDWALAASGLLERRIGGAPVYPYQPDNVWEPLAITKERDFTYPASTGKDLYRRSLYTFWRRTVQPANMFDASKRQACRVRLANTSTPLHALTTLNDPTWVEAARVLARNCMLTHQTVHERLTYAFRLVVCRTPSNDELRRLQRAYEKQLTHYQNDLDSAHQLLAVGAAPREKTLNSAEHAALAAVCLGILNLDEALTRE